tara:strand:- start:668 stop:934 length:267 start_codon:yes stop_codon:yes gene_type:complete
MELSNIECKAWYLSKCEMTLNVFTTATVDFNDGDGPQRLWCNFDYIPLEHDELPITSHSGDTPQKQLVEWLKVLHPQSEDWNKVINEV